MKDNIPIETNYTPDVLSCLADLSNDEVFTPPDVAKSMIDLLPQELFSNPNTTFLDPAVKSGVFLREIAKRLIIGLADEIPNLQERIDHIFHKQLFGIAITELTGLMSRRSVYCSKYPNSIYSVSKFSTVEGNIRYKNVSHCFSNKKCTYCGASENLFGSRARSGLDSHAYEFIHTTKPEEIFNMKFDVIIGNPPYQLNVGQQMEQYAIPLYHEFIMTAIKLSPRYLCMIVPSRWFCGGRGMDDFRKTMLSDKHIKFIEDFPDASECFPGVEIKGGVNYFLWDRSYEGDCTFSTHKNGAVISTKKRKLNEYGADFFVRDNGSLNILNKVLSFHQKSFSGIVSPQTPFGLYSSFKDFKKTKFEHSLKVYANKEIGYISENYKITKNRTAINEWKVLVPKAVGSGSSESDVIKPLIGEPGSLCTQTYLYIGPFSSKDECENVISYIKTKFFHFLVALLKNTQDGMSKVYTFVPIVDFNRAWNDSELYSLFGLNSEEQNYIEDTIWPKMTPSEVYSK
jgi:site-specific DNA-methyltransferase (adenine-specific)